MDALTAYAIIWSSLLVVMVGAYFSINTGETFNLRAGLFYPLVIVIGLYFLCYAPLFIFKFLGVLALVLITIGRLIVKIKVADLAKINSLEV